MLDGCWCSLVAIVLKLEKSEEKERFQGSTSYSKHDRTRAVVAWEETVESENWGLTGWRKMAGNRCLKHKLPKSTSEWRVVRVRE